MNKASTDERDSKSPKKPIYNGLMDLLIVAAAAGNNSEPWFIYFKPEQATKDGTFKVMHAFLRGLKPPGKDSGWAFSFDKVKLDRWHQIDNEGTPNNWHLGDFLADPEVKAMLRDRDIIGTITFRAALNGPNIQPPLPMTMYP